MKLWSSLTNRIFLASALVAALSIAFALRFVTVRIEREAEAQLDRGLVHAATLVEQHHATRLETLTLHAHLIADLPKLKAAVATGHPPTIEPLARDYQGRVKSDLFAIRDEAGAVLVALGASREPARHLPAVADVLPRGEAVSYGPGERGVQEIVTVPIAVGPDPPEVLGTLSLGFGLDENLAREFRAATESEVAFALEGHILASTLPGEQGATLARALSAGGASSLALGDGEYVAVVRSLGPRDRAAPAAIILRSRTERLQSLRTFRAGLLAAALVALLVAVLLSYAVARTVTRPLAAITAAMREMAQTGDLTSKIRLGRGGDEDARLLATTFNTLTESIARFQREAALKERLSALGRLSTVIAHEVRNPLMIVKASLRALRRGAASPEQVREAAADIEEEVARLDRIVGDVLDFARPIRVERAPTDLNGLCADAAGHLGDLPVRLALDPQVGQVVTDGERIRTALVNVLANARDAVLSAPPRAGNGRGEIRIATSRVDGDRVAIEIEDDGVGIEASDLPHVFEPYYTTKRTGSGLGLAIAKNILDALGGTLAVHSRPGEGTRVRIEIPRGGDASTPPGPAGPGPD